ncbi:mediator of RNA polymerase II transcription subunit 6 [Marchantia polymorpha subsp. ruderalis]
MDHLAPPGAMGQAPTPGTDMTNISFRDQLWLNQFPLDRNLVFDYFSLSPFYDRACSNEQLRMRQIHPLDSSQLTKMTGIEYILHEAQEPHLFVIRKQRREGPEKTTVMSAYYVLDGSIYQAPQLYSVIGSRAVRAIHHISEAFSQAAAKLEKIGHEVESGKAKPEDQVDEAAQKKAAENPIDLKEAARLDQILTGVFRRLPAAPPPPPFPVAAAAAAAADAVKTEGDVKQEPGADAPGVTAADQGPALKRVKIE